MLASFTALHTIPIQTLSPVLASSGSNLLRQLVRQRSRPGRPRTPTPMGASWSSFAGGANTNPVLDTALHSAALGKFIDPLDFSITVDRKQLYKRATAGAKHEWDVQLEVDVAHLQSRHALLRVDANMDEEKHHLHIPCSALTAVMEGAGVTVDTICNICAIHAQLRQKGVTEQGNVLAEVAIVLDVSRDGYDSRADVHELTRRVYGITDASRDTK